jgi:hypothetical protein
MNAALRQFEAAEANLEKLERLWKELRKMIPEGISFGSDPKYYDRSRAYSDVLRALPKIDGWKPEAEPPDLNDLAQNRLDALEVDEISAIIAAEESAERPARELAEYRYRLNQKRRQVIRDALANVVGRIDEILRVLGVRFEGEQQLNKHVEGADWEELKSRVKEIDMLLGGSLQRTPRWTDLNPHPDGPKLRCLMGYRRGRAGEAEAVHSRVGVADEAQSITEGCLAAVVDGFAKQQDSPDDARCHPPLLHRQDRWPSSAQQLAKGRSALRRYSRVISPNRTYVPRHLV